jgi:hypothetical protein
MNVIMGLFEGRRKEKNGVNNSVSMYEDSIMKPTKKCLKNSSGGMRKRKSNRRG